MNEEYKKLYSYLKDNGLTELDESAFFEAYKSDPSEIYNYLRSSKMTDLDYDAFKSSYFPTSMTIKKKEATTEDSLQPQEQPTPLSGENGQETKAVAEPPKDILPTQDASLDVNQILSPEVKEVKKDMEENPYKYILQGKSITPKETLDSLESQIQEINKEIESIPSISPNAMQGAGMSSSLASQSKKDELIAKKNQVRKEYKRLYEDNVDIIANEKGYKYQLDDEWLSATQFYKRVASNKMKDKMKSGDFNLKIENDTNMMDFISLQEQAAKRGFWDESLSGAAGTMYSILAGAKIKGVEAASLFADAESLADIASLSTNDVVGNAAAKKALEEAKKKYDNEDDIKAAFLRNYARGIYDIERGIRGLKFVNEQDAIDRFADGDVIGGIKDATMMSIESMPYMGAAFIPYIGTALIANSVQTQKYYEYRDMGNSKEKAAALSGLSAVAETADALVGKYLIKSSLGSAKRIAEGAGKTLGYSRAETMKLFKDIAKPFYTEMPTEFGQGTMSNIIDQVAEGVDEIDVTGALRMGAVESLAAAPTSTVMASPVLATSVFSFAKDYQQANKLQKAIENTVFEIGSVDNDSDAKILQKQAKDLVQEYVDIRNDANAVAENSTEEQASELKRLTADEIALEKALKATGLTLETRELLQEKLDAKRSAKDEIINEIKKVVSEEQQKSGAESAQESPLNVETVPAEEQEVTTQEERASKERVQKEIKGIVEKVKKRGVNEDTNPQKIIDAVMPYLQGSKLYEEMNDVERDAMYKEVLAGLGEKIKSSPSVDRLFQRKKDETTSLTTKQIIETEAKAARDAKKSLDEARKSIAEQVTGMATKGYMPAKRAESIIKKLNRVNLENNESVASLVDFIDRQFKVAEAKQERVEEKNRVNTKRKAKKKLKELGAFRELKQPLLNIMSYPIDILPKEALKLYDKVFTDLSRAGTKYFTSNRETISSELNKLNNIISKDIDRATATFEKAKDEFSDTEVFEDTIERLLENGTINQSEAEILERYRDYLGIESKFTTSEKKSLLQDFVDAKDALPIRLDEDASLDERRVLRDARAMTESNFSKLPQSVQRALVRGMEMASRGFINGNLANGVNASNWIKRESRIPLNEIKPNGRIDTIRAKIWQAIKNLNPSLPKKVSYLEEKIKSAPTFNLDEVFRVDDKMNDIERLFKKSAKDFKSTNLYSQIFRPVAVQFEQSARDLREVKTKLGNAEALLSTMKNKRVYQKAKIMLYQIEKEFRTNPNNPEVTSALDWVEATINDEKSIYEKADKDMLRKLANEFTVNGEIDLKKIEDSFTEKEKKAEKIIRNVYDSLADKAEADAVFQGKPFVRRNNYVHLPKITTDINQNEVISSLEDLANIFRRPSTKSKNVLQRTGNAHAISFDPIQNAFNASKQTISSYYMTPTLKGVGQMFSFMEKKYAGKENQLKIIESLKDVMNTIIESEYSKIVQKETMLESLTGGLAAAGYRAMLSGVVRAVVELSSNFLHAYGVYGNQFMSGVDIVRKESKADMDAAIKSLKSTHTTRLSGDADMSGKDVEYNLTKQAEVYRAEKSVSKVRDLMSPILEGGKAYKEKVGQAADWLVQRPDVAVARPLFVGLFNEKFKEITGQDVDWKKLTDNKYQEEFSDAIDKATEYADDGVTTSIASKNPFEGIPKNLKGSDTKGLLRAFKLMNRFMTTFRVFEYYSAVRGVQGLMGSGKITREEGFWLITMTVSRMALYKLGIDMLSGLLYSGVANLAGWDDDEEYATKTKEKVVDEAPNALLGAVVTLALGRNVGNIGNMLTNWGVEYANKNYGEGITWDGKFDPFDDAIMFNKIPLDMDEVYNPEKKALDIIIGSTGAYSPIGDALLDGVSAFIKVNTVETKKTKERYADELIYMTPFKVAGAMGLIPAYRDLKKIFQKRFYEEHGVKGKGKSRGSGRGESRGR